jgi:glycosyltransferase involved in cell wall biosynthesis
MSFSPKDHTWALCAYGESPYLEECIRSLKAQKVQTRIILSTSTPSEFIDGIAGKYRIPVFTHEGGGIGRDWNAAYDLAETKLVTIAHQDDLYEPGYTEEMLKEVNRSRDPILFFTDYAELRDGERVHDNRNLKIKRVMLTPLKGTALRNSRVVRRRILSMGSAICCPSVTYVKEKTGETIFSTEMKVSLDWDQWEKQSRKKGAFVYSPKILMLHRVHEESETTRLIEDHTRTKEDLEMFRRFWPEGIAGWLAGKYQKSEDSNKNERF